MRRIRHGQSTPGEGWLAEFAASLANSGLAPLTVRAYRHEVGGDAGGAESMIADLRLDAGGLRPPLDHATSACATGSRRKQQVTRQGHLHRDLRRFEIPDFPNHDDVWIMPQKRAQGASEGQPDRGTDLHLLNSRQLIFDRVLDRHQFEFRRIQSGERGVQRAGQPARFISKRRILLEPFLEFLPGHTPFTHPKPRA